MEMCVLKESDKLLNKMQNKYTIIQEKEEMLFLSFFPPSFLFPFTFLSPSITHFFLFFLSSFL